MVKLFEMRLAEDVKSPVDCPELSAQGKQKLEAQDNALEKFFKTAIVSQGTRIGHHARLQVVCINIIIRTQDASYHRYE